MSIFCAHLGCQACIQDSEGEDERVQQTGCQIRRQHVCEMDEAGTHGHQGKLLLRSSYNFIKFAVVARAEELNELYDVPRSSSED